jgi:acyl-coenzyme A thioesterase PaaI-like protein
MKEGPAPFSPGGPGSSSVWSRLAARFGTALVMRALNAYPPYLGAGVRVTPAADGRSVVSRMKLTRFNQNFVGTHFGGSLYSMCDPFFVLLLAGRLGPEYMVLDKAATIRFLKLGLGTVRAEFSIDDAEVERIKREVAERRKTEPVYKVEIRDESDAVVAEIDKTLYVRKQLKPRGER